MLCPLDLYDWHPQKGPNWLRIVHAVALQNFSTKTDRSYAFHKAFCFSPTLLQTKLNGNFAISFSHDLYQLTCAVTLDAHNLSSICESICET